MTNNIDPNETYRTAVQLREGEVNRLFQRVHFFLIGTAFLIAALVALVTSNRFLQSSALQSIAYLLTVAGLGLSLLFTLSSYRNDQIIRLLCDLLKKQPDKLETEELQGKTIMGWLDSKPHPKFAELLKDLFSDLLQVIHHPFDKMEDKHIAAPHTWIIPLGFMFFWIVAMVVIPFINGCYLARYIIISLEVFAIIFIVVMVSLPEMCCRRLKGWFRITHK